IIWGRVTMSAVKDKSSKAIAALMMIEDITSRREAEDALRASEEKLRGLFESVPVGLFQASPAGVILACNPALVTMLGYDSAEASQRRGSVCRSRHARRGARGARHAQGGAPEHADAARAARRPFHHRGHRRPRGARLGGHRPVL